MAQISVDFSKHGKCVLTEQFKEQQGKLCKLIKNDYYKMNKGKDVPE